MARGPVNKLEKAIRAYQGLTEQEQLAFDKRYQSMKALRRTVRKMLETGLGTTKAQELMPKRRSEE